ncbi:MAG TPA: hypothetical protein VE912_16320, partial [Bacteroidales bacterium]|nr:hypothetical protein [Bacteroidales bacterium]
MDNVYSFLKKIIAFLFIFLSVIVTLNAQTGPGGVGNADGSASQPKNILWLDANSLTLNNNDPVPLWTDRSGNGTDASQGTAVNQPLFNTNVLNGFPIIYFDN